MRIRVRSRGAPVAAILCLLLSGCSDVEVPANPVVFASVYDTTGFQAVLDVPSS